MGAPSHCGTKPGRFETSTHPLSHEHGSERVSKQMKERSKAVQANKQTNKRVAQH